MNRITKDIQPHFPGGMTRARYFLLGWQSPYYSLADDSRIRAPRGLVNSRDRLAVGIRPEKIRLREPDDVTPTGQNELHGVVRDASYLGVSTQYQVEARGGIRLTVYEQNVERATRAELWTRGEAVRLTWSPDHSFVVDDPGTSDTTAAQANVPIGATA